MCGIAGFTHSKQLPDPERIKKAVVSLSHRGPDDQSTYSSSDCSLAVARLSIIDVPNGHQPMLDSRRDSVIAFNGEIYNHVELRKELETLGHKFHTCSDTEVLLRAFLQWDTSCFSRLRGMFAVAVWMESKKRLVLARDRLGIKPLYIYSRRGELYFASEIKALLIHPEIDRCINMDGLNLFLSLNYVPGDLTLIDGVQKLSPGTWLEWQAGKLHKESYWKLKFEPSRPRSLDDAAVELGAMLQDSVRDHLTSDVPVGVWLSGGIDSSTILHYAAQESARPIKTFSVTFRGRSFDESRFIRQMVARYGTEHHEMDVNPSIDLPQVIEELAYHSDDPCADSGALPVWFLSRLTAPHARVVLSGDGADELFAGYSTYTADILARRLRQLPSPLLKMAVKASHLWPVSDEKVGLEYCVKRFLSGSLLTAEESHVYWNGTFTAAERTSFFPASSATPLRSLLSSPTSYANLSGSLVPFFDYDCRYYLTDDILCKVDRMSMAHSVEVRPPFLDHRIVEFSASLSDSLKMRGFSQKRVLRKLMKGALPSEILRRKKIGFDIPTHAWFRGPLRSLLRDTLSRRAIRDSGLFRAEPIESMIQAHLDRRANIGFHLWGLMNLFLWMKQWNITAGVSEETKRPCARAAAVT